MKVKFSEPWNFFAGIFPNLGKTAAAERNVVVDLDQSDKRRIYAFSGY
jgi:hypothetical protein